MPSMLSFGPHGVLLLLALAAALLMALPPVLVWAAHRAPSAAPASPAAAAAQSFSRSYLMTLGCGLLVTLSGCGTVPCSDLLTREIPAELLRAPMAPTPLMPTPPQPSRSKTPGATTSTTPPPAG